MRSARPHRGSYRRNPRFTSLGRFLIIMLTFMHVTTIKTSLNKSSSWFAVSKFISVGYTKIKAGFFTCIVTNFVIIKSTRCTSFPNLIRNETLHVSGSSSAHHQEFIHCTLGTHTCYASLNTALEQNQDGTAFPSWSCSKAVYKPV